VRLGFNSKRDSSASQGTDTEMAKRDHERLYRPPRRLVVRLFNSVVGLLDRLRSTIAFTLTPSEAIRIASKTTGVSDFSCPEFGKPLQMFCDETLNPQLTPLGRWGLRSQIIGRVATRINIEKALRADPALVNEPVENPWFILGLPRSGTTLLQRLLAQDPEHRALLFWEGIAPIPQRPQDTAPRGIGMAKFVVGFANFMAPDLKAKHELGAELPEECRLLLGNSLLGSTLWGATQNFYDWFAAVDKTPAFRLHKIQLQYLQRHAAKRRWVLKDPEHLLDLEYLLAAYPDARIIKLHRDPLEVLPSTASLITTLEGMSVREVDKYEAGRGAYDSAMQMCFSRFNTQQGSDELTAQGVRFVDVRYVDLMSDPIGTVAAIYAQFDCKLSDAAKVRMRTYLQHNSHRKHGAHRYTLEEFGLDAATIREKFAPYVERYVSSPRTTSMRA
jgi:hypothetical protein